MNAPPGDAPPVLNPAVPTERTLRRLFLTLYLRGRSSRGLRLKGAPKSVAKKLALALFIYAMFGTFASAFARHPVFALAVYLHGITFVFLGMFVSASAGEILFNKEEADILLHRPVSPRELLWSKIRVLIQVSLWLAGALNLAGLFIGLSTSDGGLLFPFVHVLSTVLEALFCTSCIILAYQLCLRWFGRERLDGLMTTVQVFVAIAAVGAGQMLPRFILRFNGSGLLRFSAATWWIGLFPPAWFAGLDDAVAGSRAPGSWLLAAFGLAGTGALLWLAFGKLAQDYQAGLQTMAETVSRPRARSQRRWTEILVNTPPIKWFFRTPISRATFLLTAAYLFRDRDVKLRVFPGLAPMLIIPLVFLFQDEHTSKNFGLAFSGGFLASIPLLALDLLQYSQQWQASDIFRVAPMAGPGEICQGARRAVLLLLTLPVVLVICLLVWLVQRDVSQLLLFLPGILLMPLVALVPALLHRGMPLSLPNEEAKSAVRTVKMFGVMLLAAILSGITSWAFSAGWFGWLIAGELIVVIPAYLGGRVLVSRLRWRPVE
jgi:ABC-2 type transport system permease protein